jgi:hypothetical protein
MMKRILGLLAAFSLLWAAPVFASPIAYVTGSNDVPNVMVNQAILNINSNLAGAQQLTACSGTTTATCLGLRTNVSITGLSTAASTLSATMTVTDTSVTASSQLLCVVNGYAGTGIPVAVNLVAGAGSFTFAIQNVSTGAALNATVVTDCQIQN